MKTTRWRQRTLLEVVLENRTEVKVEAGPLLEARDALTMTIAWLETLHPARSRVARLVELRNAHERLTQALRKAGLT